MIFHRRIRYLGVAAALAAALSLSACNDEGGNWQALNKLSAPANGAQVSLKVARQAAIGENLTLEVTSSLPGKVWVVAVDKDDRVTVLFPNHLDQGNAIAANYPMPVPAAGARWTITATEPAGRTLYGVFVTAGNVDLRDVLGAVSKGGIAKAFAIGSVPDSWGLARAEVNVVKAVQGER